MLDLKAVFLDAWSKLKPILDADPAELHARLARRHTARLTRPLREWAIALRANDRRLTPLRAAMIPEHGPDHHLPHDVEIDKPLLYFLHHPVETDFPETSIPDLAIPSPLPPTSTQPPAFGAGAGSAPPARTPAATSSCP